MSMNQQVISQTQPTQSVEDRIKAEPDGDLKELLNTKLMNYELTAENYDEIRNELIEQLRNLNEDESD